MTILDKIIRVKEVEVEKLKLSTSIAELEKGEFYDRKTLSLKQSLIESENFGIIAEFKRESPSKGTINSLSSLFDVTSGYEAAEAAGVSVLTDKQFFSGSNADLIQARKTISIPILRKDFIIDEIQILEAKSIGADAILLIASVLTKEKVDVLAKYAKSLGLEILFEIHNEKELEKLSSFVDIVGVNNRDLTIFTTDIENSVRLTNLIPKEFVKISESGIHSGKDIKYLKQFGYTGFLIGENFMKTSNPGLECMQFIEKLKL